MQTAVHAQKPMKLTAEDNHWLEMLLDICRLISSACLFIIRIAPAIYYILMSFNNVPYQMNAIFIHNKFIYNNNNTKVLLLLLFTIYYNLLQFITEFYHQHSQRAISNTDPSLITNVRNTSPSLEPSLVTLSRTQNADTSVCHIRQCDAPEACQICQGDTGSVGSLASSEIVATISNMDVMGNVVCNHLTVM